MQSRITRRTLVRRALLGSAVSTAGFPSILRARDSAPEVRVTGTHVTLQEPLRRRAEKELGIRLNFSPGGSAEVLYKAAAHPETFDIYEQWSNSIKILWQARAIQPIDSHRIDNWPEINDLSKKGRLTPASPIGAGDAPHTLLYAQPDNSLDSTPQRRVSFVPYVHNVDSFGYNSAKIERGEPYEEESWSWLLDEKHRGRVAIVNAPAIGIFDLALAAQSSGLASFKDIGNMSRNEIDALFDILVDFKRRGHFQGFWHSVPDSVRMMLSGQVSIQSMFSPAVSTLNSRNVPCIFAAPREGYRAWHGVMCLSSNTGGEQLDAAYAYMNWWLSGWPGAFIARQGYYISNPERSRPWMADGEWDYWYAGKPASQPLRGTDGRIVVSPGETRTGGSYYRRFANIAVWNSVMDNFDLTLERWNELLLA